MAFVILLAIVVLPVSAVTWGMLQGINDKPVPDIEGSFERMEDGTFELRIL